MSTLKPERRAPLLQGRPQDRAANRVDRVLPPTGSTLVGGGETDHRKGTDHRSASPDAMSLSPPPDLLHLSLWGADLGNLYLTRLFKCSLMGKVLFSLVRLREESEETAVSLLIVPVTGARVGNCEKPLPQAGQLTTRR